MQTTNTITIHAPIDRVWRLVADDFTSIARWSASVITSTPLDAAQAATAVPEGAACGRVCTFTDDPDGFAAREVITAYDRATWTLSFDVEPINAPAALPLIRNHVTVQLAEAPEGGAELTWTTRPELKWLAKAAWPVLRLGITRQFAGILAELKAYAEAEGSRAAA